MEVSAFLQVKEDFAQVLVSTDARPVLKPAGCRQNAGLRGLQSAFFQSNSWHLDCNCGLKIRNPVLEKGRSSSTDGTAALHNSIYLISHWPHFGHFRGVVHCQGTAWYSARGKKPRYFEKDFLLSVGRKGYEVRQDLAVTQTFLVQVVEH